MIIWIRGDAADETVNGRNDPSMKNTRKQRYFTLILVLALLVCALGGCAKKCTATITYDTAGSVQPAGLPKGVDGLSGQVNRLIVSLSREGTYEIKANADGKVFTITLTYANGKCTYTDDSGLHSTLEQK